MSRRWGDTDSSEGDQNDSNTSKISAPLESKWAFWFHEGGSKGQSSNEFENQMKSLGVIATVQDFWRHWNNIVNVNKLPEHSNTQLFKEGIKPAWEDQANAEGGRWTLMCSSKEETNDLAVKAALAVIGEQFEFGDDICGLVVSIRPKGDTINVWNRNCKDQKAIAATTAQLQQVLGRQNIRYQSHREAMQNNSKKQHSRNSSHSSDPISPRTKGPQTPGRATRTNSRDGDDLSIKSPSQTKVSSPKVTQTTPPSSQVVSRSNSSNMMSSSSAGLPGSSLNSSIEIPVPTKIWMDNPRIASWADEVEDEERMLGISSKSMPSSPAIHPPQLNAREPGSSGHTRQRQPYQRHIKSRSLQTEPYHSPASSSYSNNHSPAPASFTPSPHTQHSHEASAAPPAPAQALLATPSSFSGAPPTSPSTFSSRKKPEPGSPPLAAASTFQKQHRKSASVSVVETDSANALERRKGRGSPSQSPVLASLSVSSRWNGRSSLPSSGKIIPAMLDIPSFAPRHKRAGSSSDKRRASPVPPTAGLTDEEEYPDMIIHNTDEEARLASLQPGVFQKVHRRQSSKSHNRTPSGERKSEVRKSKSSQISTLTLMLQHLPFLLMILALYLISSRTKPIDIASLKL